MKLSEYMIKQQAWLTGVARYCLLRSGRGHQADDAFMDAVENAIRCEQRVTVRSCKSYATMMVINAARAILRKEQRYTPMPEHHEPSVEDAYQIGGPVEAALAKLDAKHREILVLRYVHDVAEADAARLLGTSHGTIKSRTHNAKLKFRRAWASLQERMAKPAIASI